MNDKILLYRFIRMIEKSGELTHFIINIFNYEGIHDYNYIFRLINSDCEVIIDIYDNISINRFNRYIFNFVNNDFIIKTEEENNVFITRICIENVQDDKNNLLKLGYLFKLSDGAKIQYAKTFLDNEFVIILKKIISHQ